MKLTMGSLFDGSGGFPLAGTLGGIETLWTSEIEPFPIRVTTKRFPNAKHYGDISKLNGAELEPVDIITGGSPCQDLSMSGKRKGVKRHCPSCGYETDAQDEETLCPLCDTELKYTRSGMFMEQIRVIKEMRRATNGKQPRFMLWENVPGAFSSNKGQDFKAVLEETIRVKREISLPRPPKDKWQNAGCIVGDGYSVAWRVVDARYCGVPQRRRRIVLIADFGGERAGEILFERYSLRGNFAQSQDERERTAGDTADSFGAADREVYSVDGYNFAVGDKATTLGVNCGVSTGRNGLLYAVENHPSDSRVRIDETGTVQILTSRMGTGGGNVPLVMEPSYGTLGCNNDQTVFVPFCKGTRPHSKEEAPSWKNGEVANTLNTFDVGETRCNELIAQAYNICSYASNSMKSDNPHSGIYQADKTRTLDLNGDNPTCNQGGTVIVGSNITYALDRAMFNQGVNASYEPQISDNGICPTLVARGPSAVCAYPEYIVRRLTPLECCRLQGFPSIVEVNMKEITRDEVAIIALSSGYITVDAENGKVYATRGPGGVSLSVPKELKGCDCNGYVVYSIRAGGVKKQIRGHRLVWMSVFGAIPEGMVVDHINNNKRDNRISNLQLLTPEENSHKAKVEGLYAVGDKNPNSKVSDRDRLVISFLYWNTKKPISYFAEKYGLSKSRVQQIIHEYNWTDDLETPEPTEEDIAFWRDVFETHSQIVSGKPSTKTDKQIIKWLQNPYSDSAEYKMWGNGIALPCMARFLCRIPLQVQMEQLEQLDVDDLLD